MSGADQESTGLSFTQINMNTSGVLHVLQVLRAGLPHRLGCFKDS